MERQRQHNPQKRNGFTCGDHRQLLVTTGSMRRDLQPNRVAQVVQLLQDGTSTRVVAGRLAVSPSTVSRAWRRHQETVTYGELDRSIEGHQPSSRTGICSFVRGGTAGAQNDLQQATGVYVSDQTVRNRFHEGTMSSIGT